MGDCNKMNRKDTAIDPKPIISLMFAVSVGFWANQLVQYVIPALTASDLKIKITAKLNDYIESKDEVEEITSRELQSRINNMLIIVVE